MLRLLRNHHRYEKATVVNAARTQEDRRLDPRGHGYAVPRRMIKVDCGLNGLLSGFHFEFSEGGRWARSKLLGLREQRAKVTKGWVSCWNMAGASTKA